MWPFRRRRDDLDEEIQSHLAMAARECVERGETADAARSHARREFGNVLVVKEVTEMFDALDFDQEFIFNDEICTKAAVKVHALVHEWDRDF